MNDNEFYSPELTLTELAAMVCGDKAQKARNIHRCDRFNRILTRSK